MNNIFEMLGAAFVLVTALMSIFFIVYCFKKNAGLEDLGLFLSFCLTSWVYFFLGDGNFIKRLVVTTMVTIWALRLVGQMYQRLVTLEEDSRYQILRKNWGEQQENAKFFILFIFQGFLAIVLSLPFLIVSSAAVSHWFLIELLGIAIWIIGVAGESLADYQLFQFKQNPENRDKVCQEGLWHYSRHPNYFFEFVVWIGFFLFALGTPGGWLSIISPALMLLLLTKVSGIPLAEAQALKSKGAAYEEYQKTTSSFIPWFR